MGNPTSYYNGTRWTMEWEHGRELRTISDGSTTWTNTYNADGLRIRRSDGTNTYNYVYLGGQLVKATYNDTAVMYFAYDAEGRPMSVKYNGTTYYYVTNLQGDVVGIVNQSGNQIVSYTYDAWGNILTTTGSSANTLGKYNPLRYRGYVYDRETGFYYLQSRYYDPELGRFINADALVSTGQGILGHNMFAYCGNNPINFIDHSGFAAIHNQAYIHIERNKGYDYITDQDDPAIADKHLGLATISHGGCGVIASYNALVTLGASQTFDEVLTYYNDQVVNTLGFGLMGLLPYEVAGYFSNLGYSVVTTNQKDQIDHLSQTADACIMYYEFPQSYPVFNLFSIDAYGAHFIEYHKVGSGYRGLNTNGRNGISYFTVPSDFGYGGSRYYAVGIFIYR